MPAALEGLQSESCPARVATSSVRSKSRPPYSRPQCDVRAVQLRVDVERLECAIRAGIVLVPRVLDTLPRPTPVGRVLGRPAQDIPDDSRVAAFRRQAGQAGFDDVARVLLEERCGVHAGDEHSPIETVAIIHHPSDPAGVARRIGRQSRCHQADEIALDLEIDVIGVHVVLRGGLTRAP